MSDKYSLCLSHDYNVPAERIFGLIEDSTFFRLTGADEISFELRDGGAFSFGFTNRGLIYGAFKKVVADREVAPPRRTGSCPAMTVIMEWNVEGFNMEKETGTTVVISILFTDHTTVTIEHSGIITEQSKMVKERAWREILEDMEREL